MWPITLDLEQGNKRSTFTVSKFSSSDNNAIIKSVVIAIGAVGYFLVKVVKTSHNILDIKIASLYFLMKNSCEFMQLSQLVQSLLSERSWWNLFLQFS